LGFRSALLTWHIISMNTATPFPWPGDLSANNAKKDFRSIFEHAPIAAARCDRQGLLVEMNPAFEAAFASDLSNKRSLFVYDLVPPQSRETTQSLVCDLLDSTRDSIRIPGKEAADGPAITNWTAWRLPGRDGESPQALLIADHSGDIPPVEQTLLQSQKWEAVGRMAGGVVHDFNNLFTGVMLYCDLLLSNLDARDCRRRYASEIRSAITQAASLGRQLLLFARPRAVESIPLCLNHVAQGMQDLLTRLIGESVTLDFRLEADLGLVKIDESQVQQILLNLVLNARDAMPEGGRIVVETSNCRVRSVPGSRLTRPGDAAFPCVLLVVSDNGRGMDDDTRQHVFEPFFTTKTPGKGTGLGLTTVHSIVTANRGLIHLESELGGGTRAMILFPLATLSPDPDLLQAPHTLSPTPMDELKKESFS